MYSQIKSDLVALQSSNGQIDVTAIKQNSPSTTGTNNNIYYMPKQTSN
jgi:hypothetical protein